MKRRGILLAMVAGVVALTLVAVPAIADELFGTIKSVDVEKKTMKVEEKGTEKEIEVTVTDETEYETPKKTSKIDLEKVSKNLEKAKKGIPVEITHEKGVASKVKVVAKKKAQ